MDQSLRPSEVQSFIADLPLRTLGDENGYQYNTLTHPETQIRLLQIPSAANEEHIACRMEVFHLENAPEHAAISYMWGDTSEKEKISVSDQTIEVGKNCRLAL